MVGTRSQFLEGVTEKRQPRYLTTDQKCTLSVKLPWSNRCMPLKVVERFGVCVVDREQALSTREPLEIRLPMANFIGLNSALNRAKSWKINSDIRVMELD